MALTVVFLGGTALAGYSVIGATGGSSSSGDKYLNNQNRALYQANQGVYLGYIPKGYNLAPHLPNAPVYSCPSQMNSTECQTFKASCGNGVCDPNETYLTCPVDCGCYGNQAGNPFTGRCGQPATVCQLQAQLQAAQQGG